MGTLLTASENPAALFLSGTVDLAAAAGEGKPATCNILAYGGGLMNPPGWGPIVVDLAGMQLPPQIPLLADHQSSIDGVVGHGAPTVKNGQLLVAGAIIAETGSARSILGLAKSGFTFQASIGVSVSGQRMVRANESVSVNGRSISHDRNFTLVTAGILREVSITAIGADPTTTTSIAARGAVKGTAMTFEQWLQANGFDAATLNDGQKKILRAQFDASRTEPETGEQVQARIRNVTDMLASAGVGTDQIQAAIRENWSEDRASQVAVEALRAARPQPRTRSNSGGRLLRAQDVIEASLGMSLGLRPKFVEAQYGQDVVNEAMNADNRGMGLHRLMTFVQAAAGMGSVASTSTNEFIRATFEADRSLRASGISTVGLPGILGNVANKLALAAYQEVASTWQKFCAINEAVKDFKPYTGYRMTGLGRFQQIAPNGEIKHVAVVEDAYTNQLDTHGAMIGITRRDMINDDLGMLSQFGKSLGRMGAIAIERAVFALLLSNPNNFFSLDNGNLNTGSDSVLSIEGLTAAEEIFLNQTDRNGDPILIPAKTLLVPVPLNATASSLMKATEIIVDPDGDAVPNSNPHTGKFDNTVSPWLNNQGLEGSSDSAWYLFGPAGDAAVMEVGFLDGKTQPTIESGETDFNTLGMQMRGYFDFGVTMKDHRGGVKSAGA